MMQKIITQFIFILFTFNVINAQIIRGGLENEIFLNLYWYYDGLYSHKGLFHSNDNGHSIELKYEYTSPQQTNPPLGLILDDASPGVIYNIPVSNSDFMISMDYGSLWDYVELNAPNSMMTSGSIPGEIYQYGFSTEGYLRRSTNYGQTFDTVNSNAKYSFKVGVSPGVLYGNVIYPNYIVYISYDHGYSFPDTMVLDTTITGVGVDGFYRGANLGEVYLASFWEPSNYQVYFSEDNGHSWQFRYRTGLTGDWSFSFTPGRENGSFYIARTKLDLTSTHTLLYIDYSTDTAKTFTTYFHDLTPEVGVEEIKEKNILSEIKCFPVPATNSINVSNLQTFIANKSNISIELYNISGIKLDGVPIEPNFDEIKINISSYPPGIYVVVVKNDKQYLASCKFIVQR